MSCLAGWLHFCIHFIKVFDWNSFTDIIHNSSNSFYFQLVKKLELRHDPHKSLQRLFPLQITDDDKPVAYYIVIFPL